MQADHVVHRGGCHCGNIRFEVRASPDIQVSECNCSICSKSGFLGLVVPVERFRLLSDPGKLTTYQFNTRNAKHTFCPICGIKSFYHPRSHPDGINVNARCLDSGTVRTRTVEAVDGRNWESIYKDGESAPYRN